MIREELGGLHLRKSQSRTLQNIPHNHTRSGQVPACRGEPFNVARDSDTLLDIFNDHVYEFRIVGIKFIKQ